MTIDNVIMTIAILLAPIVAIQIQKYLESFRDRKSRKINIYKTLMATRATSLSEKHIVALNSIDLEFNERKYIKVKKAWKIYLDHLNKPIPDDTPESDNLWKEKSANYLCNLLVEMGNSLNFKFDEVDIKNNIYLPIAHDNIDKEINFMRRGINEVLLGHRSIIINIQDKASKE